MLRREKPIARLGLVIVAVMAAFVAGFQLCLVPADSTWKDSIITSFSGVVSNSSGTFAVITISNGGPRSVIRRDPMVVSASFWGTAPPPVRAAGPVRGFAVWTNASSPHPRPWTFR
jgi:hypothetical protein